MQITKIQNQNDKSFDTQLEFSGAFQFIESASKNLSTQQGELLVLPSVLLVQWDDAKIDGISGLFENRGYLVNRVDASKLINTANKLEDDAYAAIVHTARFAETLDPMLNDCEYQNYFGSYTFSSSDDTDSVHCLVKLSTSAPDDLKAYVNSLWAMCNVT